MKVIRATLSLTYLAYSRQAKVYISHTISKLGLISLNISLNLFILQCAELYNELDLRKIPKEYKILYNF